MDRAHRIGQNRVVNVYRIIMQDSVEEKILELQEKKIAMSEAIVNSDNSTMYQMGTDRLLDIFTFKTDTESSDQNEMGDYDLDALLEAYTEDYASLSANEFSRTLLS
jgi:TATA-binding protein-associated factor